MSSGTANQYAASQTPVLMPMPNHVPATNNTACSATNSTTPMYFPTNSAQRGVGFASSTVTACGSRNVGRNPAVHRSASNTPTVSASTPASHNWISRIESDRCLLIGNLNSPNPSDTSPLTTRMPSSRTAFESSDLGM